MIVTAEAAKCGSVRVLALDAATGETVRDRRLADPAAGHNITMAPLAVDGMIMGLPAHSRTAWTRRYALAHRRLARKSGASSAG